MDKKAIMYKFMKEIEREKKLTKLIISLFDYQDFHDYNYLSRIIKTDKEIIFDIYDNISINRFNRYIFNFNGGEYDIKTKEENNVFVTYINVENVNNPENKLLKLAYLFKTLGYDSITYAKTFLDEDIIITLNRISRDINLE